MRHALKVSAFSNMVCMRPLGFHSAELMHGARMKLLQSAAHYRAWV